jgi:hypothetical protein
MDQQQQLRERRYQLRLTALDMLICIAAIAGILIVRNYVSFVFLFIVFVVAPDAYRRTRRWL